MAAALAVNEALNGVGISAEPKWPNDVLVRENKICGILSERVDHPTTSSSAILIGIGLNVNMTSEEADAIDRPATSIRIETGKEGDVEGVLDSLLQPLSAWIERWQQGGFASLRESWTKMAGPIGKSLTVHDGDTRTHGTLAGYGDQGELLLQTDDGLKTMWSGDVTNR
jgi:BirA family biotin operon repressor/biotin-[acetyl-CoA-carboxylase] ligase